jgi:hypothetical protein
VFPKGATDPTLEDERYPRRPRVKLFAGFLSFRGLDSFYSRTVRKDGGLGALSSAGCIESGDDLDPACCGLAFGRVAGVGDEGRLTGVSFLLFFHCSRVHCHAW